MNRTEMLAALATFSADARGADAAVIYYVGHGFFIDGRNRLLPTDARLAKTADVSLETISMDDLIVALDQAKGLRILVLDAARAGRNQQRSATSWRSRLKVTGALASLEISDVLILYSSKAGSFVPTEDRRSSRFAELLAAALAEPGLDVRRLFGRVREDVLRVSGGRQEPFVYGTLSGNAAYLLAPTPESSRSDAESLTWTRASAADTDATYSDYLRLFPDGAHWTQAAKARALRRAQRVRGGPSDYKGRTINVAADYTGDGLAEALNSAKDGDRIVLAAGNHFSKALRITKSVLITGPDRGAATIIFMDTGGLIVMSSRPFLNRNFKIDPTTAVAASPQPWIEKVQLRCACGVVNLLSGRTTMRDVHVVGLTAPERVISGIQLSSAAELTLVDSRIETPGSPIDLDGGSLIAVGNTVRMTSVGQQSLSQPVISGNLAFGLATFVENHLEGAGVIGFFINTGPYLFSDNELVARGMPRSAYILFGLMAQTKPVVLRNNRVRIGRGKAKWFECTAPSCGILLDGNRGLSQ